jgi:histidinol-phosphatase (PHP family)
MYFEYYSRVAEMVRIGGFEILGHFDLIKKRNRGGEYFDEQAPLYRKTVLDLADLLAGRDLIVEINTGGIARGAINEVYPAPWIIGELKKRGIPVQINADAHAPEQIDFWFDESVSLLRDTGYRSVRVLLEGMWQDVPL